MIYRVVHKTCYEYADAVPLSHNLVRMRPRDHSAQTCRWHRTAGNNGTPPTVDNEGLDYFGNQRFVACFPAGTFYTEFSVGLWIMKQRGGGQLELRPDPTADFCRGSTCGQTIFGALGSCA